MKNPMRDIVIDKVVINMGVGEAGEKLRRAQKVIDLLTHRKPVQAEAKKTIRDFNIRKGLPIGLKVTLRGKEAEDFLRRALWVKDFKVPNYSFDSNGNLNFGISDYTEFEGMKYDPEIGIFGMDISVVFRRRGGYRIARRRIKKKKIPIRHRVTREETMQFMRENFNLNILEVE
ncbi:ribosomal protein L5 [Aciduliprofundum sp. MAR08-339]|nr:ribosomal protein L5 [Aciduliprofundum sp. MAR08-339]